jgi:hypothetical protein
VSAICPQGHTSQAEDYCDICGSPIGAASAAPAVPSPAEPATGGEPRECPHCGSPAAPNALFCENCGYDFTTGTAPQPVQQPAPDPWALPGDPGQQGQGPAPDPSGQADPAEEGAAAGGDRAEGTPAASDPAEGAGETGEGGAGAEESPHSGRLEVPPVPGEDQWVAELWVDPDWYEAQDPEDPMPSPGSPQVIPLRQRTVLVGRPSASRGIHPEVDAGADTGVSRRHCQLSTDGHAWSVEDLDSSNGTYVSAPGDPLPTTPLQVGVRHELADGERVFIGGWTRLVVRKAFPGEF